MWVLGEGCKGTENNWVANSVTEDEKSMQKINLPLQRLRLLVGEKLFKVHQVSDSGCLQELKVPTHFLLSSRHSLTDGQMYLVIY